MKTFFTSAILLLALCCQGQEKDPVKTYYIQGEDSPTTFYGKRAVHADSANYIRTVTREKNDENLYGVVEFYLDKSVKRIGNSTSNGFTPKYNGNVISYFKNGNKAAEELYVMGKQVGISTYYYANKQLKKRVEFGLDNFKQTEKVLELNDSLGHRFLDDAGIGTFKLIDDENNLVEGAYSSGLKDKIWKTVNSVNKETYIDEYDGGKYVKGKTITDDGEIITYEKLEVLPEFKGGLSALSSFILKNLSYPQVARTTGIQGRVFVTFNIQKEGSLTDARVIKGIGGGCDEEALRVINLSPKWIPGVKRGVHAPFNFTIPINFQQVGIKKYPTRRHR